MSVKEIAYQVGLNDESHFVRDFKSTYGSSPACYRSQFRDSLRFDRHGPADEPDDETNTDGLKTAIGGSKTTTDAPAPALSKPASSTWR